MELISIWAYLVRKDPNYNIQALVGTGLTGWCEFRGRFLKKVDFFDLKFLSVRFKIEFDNDFILKTWLKSTKPVHKISPQNLSNPVVARPFSPHSHTLRWVLIDN